MGLAKSYWLRAKGSLCRRLHFLRCAHHFIDCALHVKGLLRNIVVLSFDDFLEAFHGVSDFHVTAWRSRELLGNVERLRQESLNLAGSAYGEFLVLAQFVHTQNCDDVLQVFVGLDSLLHCLSNVVMLLPNNSRIKNSRCGTQW